jgi:hypothetical protein
MLQDELYYMDLSLIIICLLVISIIALLIFNFKIGLNNLQMAYAITGIAFGAMILLFITYNAHPECDAMINVNNVTLDTLQQACYKYINY